MENLYKRSTFGSALFYKDPFAALDWLEKAFDFERSMVITDREGKLAHSEMKFGGGDGYIMVGSEWADFTTSPASVAGKNTQTIHVHLSDGIDAHCARARAAGATIIRGPEDQFYGDRTYMAKDLEGHVWSFGQTFDTSRARKLRKRAASRSRDGFEHGALCRCQAGSRYDMSASSDFTSPTPYGCVGPALS